MIATPIESPFTVAVLAGGAGARLGGRDKGLRRFNGRPLISWVVDRLREHASAHVAQLPILIVANRNIDRYMTFAPTISDSRSGFAGPLAGIAAALAVCTTPWLLTVPVDCPCPPSDLPSRLLDNAASRAAVSLVAHDGKRRQPLFALYRSELATSAAAAVAGGQGVWQWQESLEAIEVDFSDESAQFVNLNTPDDFSVYRKSIAVIA
ncbi:MAG: molybdenum cofactor guanylyltransferase MobA [Dokdonella sp.]